MDAPTMVANTLQTNAEWIALALEGLTDDDLMSRPNAQCNPMGWTLWHQYRVEDRIISAISGQEQAWTAGGWHAKFALPADLTQIGQGRYARAGHGLTAHSERLERLWGHRAGENARVLAAPHTDRPRL